MCVCAEVATKHICDDDFNTFIHVSKQHLLAEYENIFLSFKKYTIVY